MNLTKQDIFDTVVEHFKQQKVPAFSEDLSTCVYRTQEGLKCAFGCLLTDEEYKFEMEENDVLGLYKEGFLPKRFEPFLEISEQDEAPVYVRDNGILTKLQQIHDKQGDGGTLLCPTTATQLRAVAKEFNLDASKVNWA